jgi:proteasome accessory factor B
MEVASRPPLRRLLLLDRMIRAGEYPNARLAAEALEVHPRTIHRDLDFLRDSLEAPLAFCHRRNGYYYRDPYYPFPLLHLTEGDLVALCLAGRALDQYRGTPYTAELATAFAKLTAALPDRVTIDLNHLRDAYSFRQHGTDPGDAERFRQLARATREGRQLELVYWTASRDDTCRRGVDPYHLASIEGDWFLVGYCHLREAIRTFAPGRLRSLRETGERFDRPADFRIADYLDAGFRSVRGSGPLQRVKLHFIPEAARYVRERVWHPSQALADQPDGSLILTIEVNHLLEVKRWVLSYGAACRVLEPPELRREVEEEMRRIATGYETVPGIT